MADPAKAIEQNLLPVQAYFDVYGNFQTFIGQGKPFYASINPVQSGLTITNSTINSTTIGALVPSTGVFTDIQTTTGQISTAPVATTDIVNKAYVDAVAQGLGPKAACAVGTTVNLASLSGLPIIDTYQTVDGDRVLVKNQGTSSQNGIYVASSGAWSRSVDMNVWSEVPGAYTVLLNGTQLNTGWVCTAVKIGTIDVTAMPWVQFAANNTYFAGTGLTLASATFSITNTGVTAGTYGTDARSMTLAVNAQGQITSIYDQPIAIAASQITSGTLDVVRGGTGQSSYTDGQILIGNTTGNTLVKSTLTAGTGISIGNGAGAITVTNSAPDQIVSLTGAGTTTVTGTYPSFTITSADAYTGTVTSVGTGTGLTGGTITTTGTISFAVAAVGTWAATPSSANLASALTDETGSGLVVFNDAPSLSRPTIDGANPYIQFSNGASVALAAGRQWYDGATGSWNLGMGGGNITQQVGEELFVYGKASAAITDSPLQIIYQTGTVGASGVITFAPTIAGITDGNLILGVATENIANNGLGRITSYGVVRNITTNGTAFGETWADGDEIYYNPVTGNPTNIKPVAPNVKVSVGTIINAGSGGSGSIQVEINHGSVLGGTDSNVQITSPLNLNLLQYNGTYWTNVAASTISVSTATNLAGGSAGVVPYQSGAGATAFTAVGSAGQVLTSQGSGVPTWTTPTAYATVTDDTTTNGTRYPLFANQTAGNLATSYTSSTKYQFNPSTGILTATGFSGSGAGLTSIPNSALTNSSITIGSTAISLGASSTTLAGLTSVTSTTFVGALTGNADSATTATTATNANNVAVTDNTSSSATWYPTLVSTTTGNLPVTTSSTKLNFVPSTGFLYAGGSVLGTGAQLGTNLLTLRADAGASTTPAITLDMYGLSLGSLAYRKAGGTIASPSATAATSIISILGTTTGDGTTFANTAAIQSLLEATATPTSQPTAFTFAVTPVGAVARTEVLRIRSTGAIAFSGATNYGSANQLLQSNGNAAPTWVSSITVTGETNSGNLTFTGTGNRIFGDWSTATLTNRPSFQTSVVNGNTSIFALPNGTGPLSQWVASNNSDPTNAGVTRLYVSSTESSLQASITGTGTYLPLTLWTNGTEKLRIAADATGTYTFGGTAPRITGDFTSALSSRVLTQTNTVDSSTNFGIIPNGTSSQSLFAAFNNSTPTNSSVAQLWALSTEISLRSAIAGTGTYLPLTFYTNNSSRFQIGTAGQWGIGGANYGTSGQTIISGGASAAPAWGTLGVAGGGTGLTSLTANQILYASGTTTVAQSAGLTFNGTNFATTGTSSALSFTSTGGRSFFSAASEPYAIGVRYVSTGGPIYFGAVDGTATPDGQISNAGGSSIVIFKNSRVVQFGGYGAGTLTTDASGNITAISDENNKKNIKPFTKGLAAIVALANANNGVITYGYTLESGLDQTKDDYVGWSAQEVQKIIPEAVGKMSDTLDSEGKVVEKGCLTLNPIAITAAMNNAIKELNDLLIEQQQAINIIKSKIDLLTISK